MTPETLVVAMPVYDRVHWQAWRGDLMLAARLARRFPEGSLAFIDLHGLPQPHAQNLLIRRCLDMAMPSTGLRPDWILWVEGDTVPPPDSYDKLRAQAHPDTAPVVHGLSVDRDPPYQPSAWRFVREGGKVVALRPLYEWEPDKMYRVDHSGTCLTLFHSSVFGKLKEPWFRMRPFLQGEHKGAQCCISLSARMHGAGIPIWLYTGCLVPHVSAELVVDPTMARAFQRSAPTGMRPISDYADELQKELQSSTSFMS